MSDTVLYEIRDQVAHITLNRPEVMNAQNLELRERLNEVILDFNSNPDVLVGIVTGAGDRAFSTGMDLKERAIRNDEGDRELPPQPLEISKPIIAAIHGFCIAAGLELALRCDIRIATPDSQFGLPEPRWSLLAGYGLHNLNRMVPLGEALYMQLTGDRISAQRGYEIGLIQRIVPAERLIEEATQVADSILLCAPLAVQAIKRIVMTGKNLPIEYSWKYAEPIQDRLTGTEDSIEGPRAFAEKRRPVWKSR